MKKAAIEKQKILDFIKSHQGISLDEIKRWGELDFIKGYMVNEFCRELVSEGLVQTTLVADGVTLYSVVK